jgi:hypothetical protein
VLYLDKRNALIADEVQQTATVDHTPVYPREVIKRALELSATAILLVHEDATQPPLAHFVTADPVIGVIESDFLQGMNGLVAKRPSDLTPEVSGLGTCLSVSERCCGD